MHQSQYWGARQVAAEPAEWAAPLWNSVGSHCWNGVLSGLGGRRIDSTARGGRAVGGAQLGSTPQHIDKGGLIAAGEVPVAMGPVHYPEKRFLDEASEAKFLEIGAGVAGATGGSVWRSG